MLIPHLSLYLRGHMAWRCCSLLVTKKGGELDQIHTLRNQTWLLDQATPES